MATMFATEQFADDQGGDDAAILNTVAADQRRQRIQDIFRLYRQYLKRDPDPGGLEFYSNPEFSLALIEQDIANSPEARGQASAPAPTAAPVAAPAAEATALPAEAEDIRDIAVAPSTRRPVVAPTAPEAGVEDFEPGEAFDENMILPGFDWQTYVNANQDLQRAGINTEIEAKRHYAKYGFQEGRPGTPNLSAMQLLEVARQRFPLESIRYSFDPGSTLPEDQRPEAIVAPSTRLGPYTITPIGEVTRFIAQPVGENEFGEIITRPMPDVSTVRTVGYEIKGVTGTTPTGVNYQSDVKLGTEGQFLGATVNYKTGSDSGYILTYNPQGQVVDQSAYDESERWRLPTAIALTVIGAIIGAPQIGAALGATAGSASAAFLGGAVLGGAGSAIMGAEGSDILKGAVIGGVSAGGAQLAGQAATAANTALGTAGTATGQFISGAAQGFATAIPQAVASGDYSNILKQAFAGGLSSTVSAELTNTLKSFGLTTNQISGALAILRELASGDPNPAALASAAAQMANTQEARIAARAVSLQQAIERARDNPLALGNVVAAAMGLVDAIDQTAIKRLPSEPARPSAQPGAPLEVGDLAGQVATTEVGPAPEIPEVSVTPLIGLNFVADDDPAALDFYRSLLQALGPEGTTAAEQARTEFPQDVQLAANALAGPYKGAYVKEVESKIKRLELLDEIVRATDLNRKAVDDLLPSRAEGLSQELLDSIIEATEKTRIPQILQEAASVTPISRQEAMTPRGFTELINNIRRFGAFAGDENINTYASLFQTQNYVNLLESALRETPTNPDLQWEYQRLTGNYFGDYSPVTPPSLPIGGEAQQVIVTGTRLPPEVAPDRAPAVTPFVPGQAPLPDEFTRVPEGLTAAPPTPPAPPVAPVAPEVQPPAAAPVPTVEAPAPAPAVAVVISANNDNVLVLSDQGTVQVLPNNTGTVPATGAVVTVDPATNTVVADTGNVDPGIAETDANANNTPPTQQTADSINNTVTNLASSELVTGRDVDSGAATAAVVNVVANTGATADSAEKVTQNVVEQVTQPAPAPAPISEPTPEPAPEPTPEPVPAPVPTPAPATQPGASTAVIVAVNPNNNTALVIDTTGAVQIAQVPTPDLQPGTIVDVTVNPDTGTVVATPPVPDVTQQPQPEPEPAPAPQPEPTPEPTPPATAEPTPEPSLQPEVAPEPEAPAPPVGPPPPTLAPSPADFTPTTPEPAGAPTPPPPPPPGAPVAPEPSAPVRLTPDEEQLIEEILRLIEQDQGPREVGEPLVPPPEGPGVPPAPEPPPSPEPPGLTTTPVPEPPPRRPVTTTGPGRTTRPPSPPSILPVFLGTRQPTQIRGLGTQALQESLTSFRPAGEIRAGTGKPRRNVWNEASLRLKDALGL